MSNDFNLEKTVSEMQDELNIPEDPGPALAGKTPAIGSIRRKNDIPVLRDELKNQI